MPQESKRVYEFGRFRLDPAERLVLCEGRPVSLKPKVLDTLILLVENRGRMLDKGELMQRLWPDSFVEEANLTVNISQLRKALGQVEEGERYIETVPKRGYRFVADVRELRADAGDLVPAPSPPVRVDANEQPVRPQPIRDAVEERSAGLSQRARAILIGAPLVLVAAVGGIMGYERLSSGRPPALQEMTVTRLTTIGGVGHAVISPDGRYLAYVVNDVGQQSLWVRHVATASYLQLVPPADAAYDAVTFSPDGDTIYYVRTARNASHGTLHRIGPLGGPSHEVMSEVGGGMAISPDGRRVAFLRGPEGVLMTANMDGSDVRRIAARTPPDSLVAPENQLAWSPDSSRIACFARSHDHRGTFQVLITVRLDDGREERIGATEWQSTGGLAWLPDGSGLVMVASNQAGAQFDEQIWHVSYPAGEVRRVTNDLNGYAGLSLTADGQSLVSTQENAFSSIWIAPNSDARRATRIASGSVEGRNGLAFTPDGRLVYSSRASGNIDLWIMNADGTARSQLTIDPFLDYAPTVTTDGRFIVFVSNRSGAFNIWRIEIDGNNPTRLTSGVYDYGPQPTPDGKSVVYVNEDAGKPTLWKVGMEGGSPVQLTDRHSLVPAVSPDGKYIAYSHLDPSLGGRYRIAIIPIDGGAPIKLYDYPPGLASQGFMHWMPDGRGLTYSGIQGSAKIWLQPREGGPPRELTDFQSDRIWSFAWSRDASQLACSRGTVTGDAVLIGHFR
jgi:Tol biopolymer transport system component/DNA-binding winged helix-turn-helix (wHTH) protein